MANEVVRLTALGTAPSNPVNFTISDGAEGGVEKGTIMKLSGAYTCGKGTALGDVFAGFANSEKVASDGSTTIGLDTCGVYDCLVHSNGGFSAGELLIISGANMLCPLRLSTVSGANQLYRGIVAGKALEPITSSSDTIAVAIGVY